MPQHSAPPRPSSSARRRRLATGCAALVASLALAACGTANGALRPEPGTTTAAPSSPTGPVPTAPASPSAPPPSGPPSPGPSASAPPPSGSPSSGPPVSGPPVSGSAPATPPVTSPPTRTPAPKPTTPRPPTARPTTPPAPAPSPTTTAPRTPAPPAPSTGVSTAIVSSTASGGRTVALTFDDGPGPATGQVLDLLAQYHAKATFCLVGKQAAADPATVRRIVAAGHRLCDHSVDHPQPFAALPHDRAVRQITDAEAMIVRAGGPGSTVGWFRAPGGAFTEDNRRIAADNGLRPLGWSVDPRDWSRPGTAAIVSAVRTGLRPGGVVLLHDGGGDRSQTVAALRQLLPWLVAQGYRFDVPAS
ncbi:polysaccharide deacetylase family protein [Streptomyces sp. BE303]|uniref:polysaccharide deacetylase family protein n=1 Tax=Streptomyces sp. BE303 TaxID=3002528 RepID=UPI002E7A2307|nr:polysaccharide deacetylase family protein [Streptomyces sp. BE303]MED7954229.1 polysaccharide deacetylase family protein [Streptomyces sp. BE303]